MCGKFIPAVFALVLCVVSSRAQTPAFTIVQAAPASSQPAFSSPATPAAQTSPESALRLLQEMKAANQAILAKQAETLLRLEEIEKAAEQIKIYSKRT